jgi:iron complex outermembrane receptor protein
VFHTEFDDLQVSNYVPGDGLVIGNAASATTKGAELAADWHVGGGLSLGLSAGYLDAKYDDFPGGPCLAGTVCPDNPVDNNIGGSTIPGTSEWSGNVHGGYEAEVFGGMLFSSNLIVAYRSEYDVEANLNPDSHQDSYAKVDARVALSGRDDKWQIALLGKNLTDKHTFNFSYFWPFGPVPHRLRYLEETRTVQLQLRYTL